MKKIYKENQLLEAESLQLEVSETIRATIEVLDDNYGADIDIESDLGGYIVIAENIVDIEILKQDKLQGLIPEYTDIIECSEVVNGVNWTSSLFLLSSDFSIVVITTEELSKFLLK